MASLDYYQFNLVRGLNNRSFLQEWVSVEILGKGTFGTVYKAKKDTGAFGIQYSAIKIIQIDKSAIDRYVSEVNALKSLSDEKNIVRIEDCSHIAGKGEDYLVIRMELLRPLPKTGMSEAAVVRMGIDICKALERCHKRRPPMIHRDIKPANILRTSSGSYKLGDFGEARLLDSSLAYSVHGSSPFMSPEVRFAKGYDHRADIYSLGLTMYTLLNGGWDHWPFYKEGEQALARRLNGEKFPPIQDISRDLQSIIGKMCELDPAKRFQKAAFVRLSLEKMIQPVLPLKKQTKLQEAVFCPQCGKSIMKNANFCTFCGESIASTVKR